MISKINRVRKLGLVFADFSWSAVVPAFRAFNLVYGWNGCGKTTLTRLFDMIARGDAGEVEYEVEDVSGAAFRSADQFPTPIRVFNQDYVQSNVRVLESSANTISVLLGAENKELATQIEADERLLNGLPGDGDKIGKVRELRGYTEKKIRKEKGNDTAFTDIAKTIGAAIVGSGAASRTYRAPDAKKDFSSIKAPALLSDEERERHILALKQEMLPEVEPVQAPSLDFNGKEASVLEVLAALSDRAAALCIETVESETVRKLIGHPDIAAWVEAGLHLHNEHSSKSCEFCGNEIPKDRLAQLARHFSEADRRLKADVEAVVVQLRDVHRLLTAVPVPDAARLYRELQADFAEKRLLVEDARTNLLAQVTAVGKALQEKKLRTTEAVELGAGVDVRPLADAIETANAVIEMHNRRSKDFMAVQRKSVGAIKVHYLSTIFDDVTRRNGEIAELVTGLARRSVEIDEIRARVAAARAKISSAHAACEQINEGLRTFLGRDELRFVPEEREADGDGQAAGTVLGYRIMRGDEPAVYLSEGEKTALGFVYFVVHLNDGQFPKRDGIVVIDDPISSLDSNSLYQAFSFLKNAVAGCQQVFVLTHNFDFLKLLLNWRKRDGGAGYYMIKNHIEADERRASIVEMDKELRQYESEYHYLFKRLKEMRTEQDGTIMRAYPVPNIARKVWDTFLTFQVPNGESQYQKMKYLKTQDYSAEKLDAIYKFTNDQSHITGAGFDPALVPETQKVLAELFEMMEQIAPEHFRILDRATAV
ncbi:MAG: Translation-disabling ACNase RloC [Parcubacteria bacterium C7867-004]|nr:MAG: Translation-disabling ACNase RloC [Parcubacteria bacterium C7867-004]